MNQHSLAAAFSVLLTMAGPAAGKDDCVRQKDGIECRLDGTTMTLRQDGRAGTIDIELSPVENHSVTAFVSRALAIAEPKARETAFQRDNLSVLIVRTGQPIPFGRHVWTGRRSSTGKFSISGQVQR